MSTSTEPKSPTDETENTEKSSYNVDEDGQSEIDQFLHPQRKLLRTSSILNEIIEQIHPEIIARSHQSNFVVFPPKLEGCHVIDLGCGVGRDCFILSKLVGEDGRVIGIDSDKQQLEFARQHIDYHLKKFTINKPNLEFIQGEIDELGKVKIPENSIDVVVSNSIINHRRNKKAIIEGVCKLLKPGGEFYFSDVYVNRAIPEEYQDLLAGEYFGGALRWEDLILYATEAGFTQPRLVAAKPLTVENEDIEKAIGNTKFVSAIFRCFKLPLNENEIPVFNSPFQLTYETPLFSCEDEFFFDHLIQFKLGEFMVVEDPSVALALSVSRYKDNFTFDPIDDTNTPTTTVEIVEELSMSPRNNEKNTNEIHGKTTTITTIISND